VTDHILEEAMELTDIHGRFRQVRVSERMMIIIMMMMMMMMMMNVHIGATQHTHYKFIISYISNLFCFFFVVI
jgi:hypothetical protein